MLENTPQSSGNYEVCGKGLGKACCKNGLKLIRYTIYWKQQLQQQKLGTYLLLNFITLLHRYLLDTVTFTLLLNIMYSSKDQMIYPNLNDPSDSIVNGMETGSMLNNILVLLQETIKT